MYHIRDGIDHEDIGAITVATDMKLYNRTITDATRNAIAKMDYMDILDHRIQGDSIVNSLTPQIIEELQIFDELHQNNGNHLRPLLLTKAKSRCNREE